MTQAKAEVLANLHKEYNMRDRDVSVVPPAAFVDQSAIAGPPERCIGRIREVIDLGIDRIAVLGPPVDADEDEEKRCAELLVREVLPAFSG